MPHSHREHARATCHRGVRLGRWAITIGAVVLAAGPLASESARAVAPTYTVTDLGDLIGLPLTFGALVNDSGTVVVNTGTSVYSWSRSGGFVNIGNLGGTNMYARDINASGWIVGQAEITPPSSPGFHPAETHAFVWSPGGPIHDLGTLGEESVAMDISDTGQIVGQAARHAFSWTSAGGIVDLGTAGEHSSFGLGVNNAGDVIVRSLDLATLRTSSFIWSAASGRTTLPDLGGGDTAATVINGVGAVAGMSTTTSGARHPFLWTALGGMKDLDFGSTSSFGIATAINDAGAVAGRVERLGGAVEVAFYWSSSTGLLDLPTLGGDESEAAAMNEQGEVVGYSVGLDNREHGFVWTEAEGTTELDGIEARDINESGQITATLQVPVAPDSLTSHSALIERFDPDADGDGVDDSLQSVPGQFTDENVPVTYGSVGALNGNTVRITDVATPDGVRIAVAGVGTTKTTFSVCGMTLKLAPGSEVIVTCGSLKVQVITGSAEISVGDGHLVVTVPSGATAKVSDLGGGVYNVDNLGSAGGVTVAIDGVSSNLPAGGTKVVSLAVAYAFQGFAAPIDNLPAINSAKAGQTVPVKWRITDSRGVVVSDPSSFSSVTTVSGSCPLAAPLDAVETYSGNSGLQYLGDGWWQFNWKTPKTYAGLCREMHLNLADGSVHKAAFIFK